MSETSDGTATTISKTFSRETRISAAIDAPPSTIWRLLTNAQDYPTWNSTVVSIDGEIAPGSKIKLVSTLDPSRTFSLKVKEFQAPSKLSWGDALGTRTYTITETNDGRSLFEMSEKIGGPVFPLFASKIPSFDASFTQFTADLKAAAEKAAA